mmetsp:Transcript_12966/g.22892  ORF Transcript_12966/g.22892 Transcript_12966/m.22892 type:complete len:260 (+) Transcript_12966:901-1680(+)
MLSPFLNRDTICFPSTKSSLTLWTRSSPSSPPPRSRMVCAKLVESTVACTKAPSFKPIAKTRLAFSSFLLTAAAPSLIPVASAVSSAWSNTNCLSRSMSPGDASKRLVLSSSMFVSRLLYKTNALIFSPGKSTVDASETCAWLMCLTCMNVCTRPRSISAPKPRLHTTVPCTTSPALISTGAFLFLLLSEAARAAALHAAPLSSALSNTSCLSRSMSPGEGSKSLVDRTRVPALRSVDMTNTLTASPISNRGFASFTSV